MVSITADDRSRHAYKLCLHLAESLASAQTREGSSKRQVVADDAAAVHAGNAAPAFRDGSTDAPAKIHTVPVNLEEWMNARSDLHFTPRIFDM